MSIDIRVITSEIIANPVINNIGDVKLVFGDL